MTPRQMDRALRKWGISIVYDVIRKQWVAGDCFHADVETCKFEIETFHNGSRHIGVRPEIAVEDYCNAHNLEWDV